ncbi:MAG: hypothetical protein ACO3JV_13405 [Pseudomonadales bacterium]
MGIYVETLRKQIEKNEITFPRAVDFLTARGIHELTAIRLLTGYSHHAM